MMFRKLSYYTVNTSVITRTPDLPVISDVAAVVQMGATIRSHVILGLRCLCEEGSTGNLHANTLSIVN